MTFVVGKRYLNTQSKFDGVCVYANALYAAIEYADKSMCSVNQNSKYWVLQPKKLYSLAYKVLVNGKGSHIQQSGWYSDKKHPSLQQYRKEVKNSSTQYEVIKEFEMEVDE